MMIARGIITEKNIIEHPSPTTMNVLRVARVEKRDRGSKSDDDTCTNVTVGNKKRREWQLCDNWQVRNYMTDLISMLLREKRPNATKEWQDKIPRIAQRLEEAIYYQSEKFDEYANPSTLKARLQQLALSVRGKNVPKNSGESLVIKCSDEASLSQNVTVAPPLSPNLEIQRGFGDMSLECKKESFSPITNIYPLEHS